ncbi:hypothetical protein BV898_16542 [Hypsibius exemplaris]|uniref:Uncharacterized protein n=1 Tax=Hypsibius exemplaris TaxID=2072580 RepID=A0A9X6NF15_HYPEX|nr:hypothetical protein BV898_16542 [Hypsibius exemplaris]
MSMNLSRIPSAVADLDRFRASGPNTSVRGAASRQNLMSEQSVSVRNSYDRSRISSLSHDQENLDDSRRSESHWAHFATELRRVATFKDQKWTKALTKCALTTPRAMAAVGWYCTGPDSVKCFACEKEMEEWDVTDDPVEVHASHCKDCPLNIHGGKSDEQMTWRERIRLDIAIEFHHKALLKRMELARFNDSAEANRASILALLSAAGVSQNSAWKMVRHPARLMKLFKRAQRASRSVSWLAERPFAIPTQQGSFSQDLTHYQSHFMPAYRSGSLQGLDRFIQQQSPRCPNLFFGHYPMELLEPTSQPLAHIYSARYWETGQSVALEKWHTEAIIRSSRAAPVLSEAPPPAGPATPPAPSSETPKVTKTKEEKLALIASALSETLPKLFVSMHNYHLYHRDVVFENRIRGITTRGINDMAAQLVKYRTMSHIVYSHINVDLLKVTQHLEDNSVRVRWRINMIGGLKPYLQFWKFFNGQAKRDFLKTIDGFSIFYVGEDGLIYKHVADRMMPDDEKSLLENVNAKLATKLAGVMGFILPAATSGGLLGLGDGV